MGEVYFVSGIDTGIGKTAAVGLMCRALRKAGRDWISVKMVQTGCDGFSEDLEAHRSIAGVGAFPEDAEGLTAPQIFKFPSSPLLAARLEGREVDVAAIVRAVRACAMRHEVVLVESAGGLDVPLTHDTLSVDVAAAEGWRLVLVTCGRLGAINHALLSLDAAEARGVRVSGVVHNMFFSDDARIDRDAAEALSRRLDSLGQHGRIATMPRFPAGGPYPDVDFSEIFG